MAWKKIYTVEELEARPVRYVVYPLDSPSVRLRQWAKRQVDDRVLPGAGELIQLLGMALAMAGVFGCVGLTLVVMWLLRQGY